MIESEVGKGILTQSTLPLRQLTFLLYKSSINYYGNLKARKMKAYLRFT